MGAGGQGDSGQERHSRSLLLGYSGSSPSVVLIEPGTGEVRPFASPVDRGIAADRMYRCGDGVVIKASGLYGIDAGLRGPMVRHDRSGLVTPHGVWVRADPTAYELRSWRDEVRAEVPVQEATRVLGLVDHGLVIKHGRTTYLVRQDSSLMELSGEGRVAAVGAEHLVRVSKQSEVSVVDLLTGIATSVDQPSDITGWWDWQVVADPSGQLVAISGMATPQDGDEKGLTSVLYVLELASCRLRRILRVDGPQSPVWSHDGGSLFVGDVYHRLLHIVDVASATVTGVLKGARLSSPKVDIGDLAPPIGEAPPGTVRADAKPATASTLEQAEAQMERRLVRLPDEMRTRARSMAMPSVRLLRAEDQRVTKGATRLGGRPDLPDGVPWPAKDGVPLAFLAQVSLHEVSELIPSPLPDSGLLLFFFGPFLDEVEYPATDESAVLFVPETSGLVTKAWPADLPVEARFEAVAVELAVEMTVRRDSNAGWGDDETMWDQLEDALTGSTIGPLHRLFGFPDPIQSEPMDDLLLQLDGDIEVGWTWGDGGRVFFTHPSLRTRSFDVTRVIAREESH